MAKQYTELDDILSMEVTDMSGDETTVKELLMKLKKNDLVKLRGIIKCLMLDTTH